MGMDQLRADTTQRNSRLRLVLSACRRLFRYRLRTLIAFVTICAVALGAYRIFVAPYLLQNEIRLAIKAAGGSYEIEPAPAWLRFVFGDANVCVVKSVKLNRYTPLDEGLAESFGLVPLHYGESAAKPDAFLLYQLPELNDLEALDVSSQDVTDEMLASWSTLTRLKSLNLSETLVRDPNKWPDFPLTTLNVSSNLLRDEQIATLCKYGSLEELNLSATAMTDQGMASLAPLRRLKNLNISFTGVTPDCIDALQSFPNLDCLKAIMSAGLSEGSVELFSIARGRSPNDGIHISLNESFKTPDFGYRPAMGCGFAMMPGRPPRELWLYSWSGLHLDKLGSMAERTRLLPSDPILRGSDLRHLTLLPNLYEVNLHEVVLRDEDMVHFQSCPELTELRLPGTPITDSGVAMLGSLLPRLDSLDLDNTCITDAAMDSIGECCTLTFLNLAGTQITDAGLKHLAHLEQLDNLILPAESIRGPGLQHFLKLRRVPYIRLEQNSGGKWRLRSRQPPAPLNTNEVRNFITLADAIVSNPDHEPRGYSSLDWFSLNKEEFMPSNPRDAILVHLLAEYELTPQAMISLPDGGESLKRYRARR